MDRHNVFTLTAFHLTGRIRAIGLYSRSRYGIRVPTGYGRLRGHLRNDPSMNMVAIGTVVLTSREHIIDFEPLRHPYDSAFGENEGNSET